MTRGKRCYSCGVYDRWRVTQTDSQLTLECTTCGDTLTLVVQNTEDAVDDEEVVQA